VNKKYHFISHLLVVVHESLDHLSYVLLLATSIQTINSKVHVYFYHIHTRGRAWVKLGDVDACKMHTYTLLFIVTYSDLFTCYEMLYSYFALINGDFPSIPIIWFITL
jgi:hypothetical protein